MKEIKAGAPGGESLNKDARKKISHIVLSTTLRTGNKEVYKYTVYYKNGKIYEYSMNDTLPDTVLIFIIESDNYTKKYTSFGKVERFY